MDKMRKSERGYVLVVIAGVLVILLGFAALAVDVGIMYAAHTAAQRAADAAALGGAFTFIANPYVADPKTFAETRATTTAIENTILGATIQSSELQPPPFADLANRRVTVNITHTIPTFFAGVLGQKFATVSVVAYAEADARPADSIPCVKPWFIPNNAISALGCKACTNDPKQVIIEAGDSLPNTWTQNFIANQSAPFTLKPNSPSQALSPGNFFAIVLGNDIESDANCQGVSGGCVYENNIAKCGPESTIRCGDIYNVKPGNMVGPTSQGASRLISFGITDKANQLDPYRDSWVNGNPTFLGPLSPSPPATSGTKTSSHQVVLAPIWDVCNTVCAHPDCLKTPPGPECGKLPENGSNAQIAVIGFAMVFINDIVPGSGVEGGVSAYLVGATGCGSSPGGGTVSGVLGYPLRLVRMH